MDSISKELKTIPSHGVPVYIVVLCLLATLVFVAGGCIVTSMPGRSWSGPLADLSESEQELRDQLRTHISILADKIGERNYAHYKGLQEAAWYIENTFERAGYSPIRQNYYLPPELMSQLGEDNRLKNMEFSNIIAEKLGTVDPSKIFVIGAHYDSVAINGCPGANDNASGVAATLALARAFSNRKPKITVRFVAFANEEPPFFQTKAMGSYVYAMDCKKKGENIIAMITPETIGYYSDQKGSQRYPFPLSFFYPDQGNFIAFIGDTSSKELVRRFTAIFREQAQFPSEGAALPGFLPGIGWSDHWSFWKAGYEALMVTDTAPFRYPHYHTAEDTIDKIDFDRMTKVVAGLEKVLIELTDEE